MGNTLVPLMQVLREGNTTSMEPLVTITTKKYTKNMTAKACETKFLTWLFIFQDMQPLMEVLFVLYGNAALNHLLLT